MKKIITILLSSLILFSVVGCSSTNVKRDPVLSEDLSKVLETVYERADLDDDFREALQYYQTTKLDDANKDAYIENSDIKFTEGVVSAPLMSSIPYELVLLKLDENTDVELVKESLKENANPRKWMCVEAEDVIVESIDNTVLFLMANNPQATAIKDAFMSLAEVK